MHIRDAHAASQPGGLRQALAERLTRAAVVGGGAALMVALWALISGGPVMASVAAGWALVFSLLVAVGGALTQQEGSRLRLATFALLGCLASAAIITAGYVL